MVITEAWVGQAAGGRVFKEARAMLRLGKVAAVSAKETSEGRVFQAQVGSGKPMRVVVKVLGPTHVKNLCSCAMARSTGAMCEHAAAVLLAAVVERAEGQVKEQKPANHDRVGDIAPAEVVPMEVRISPRFPGAGIGSVHIRISKDTCLRTADYRLAEWLAKNLGKVGPAVLSLSEDQLAAFYRALGGHSRVFRGDELMNIDTATLRPRLELELEGEMMWFRLGQAGDGGSGSELIMLGDALADWHEHSCQLVIASDSQGIKELPRVFSGLLDPADLLKGEWLQMQLADFVAAIGALSQLFELPGDLGGLDIHEGEPVIELEIAGSTRALQARLKATYAKHAGVVLASTSKPDISFPVDSGEAGKWLVRNPEHEQRAIAVLMESGFEVLDAAGGMLLRGEDEVMDFLTVVLPGLRRQWQVSTEQKLARIEQRIERITPHIEPRGAGNDWLACDLTWQLAGRALDKDVVGRMLQSGSRTMTVPGGAKAVISHFDAELISGFLLDADPRQEDGHYYFPTKQAAYLARLRAHYGADEKKLEQEVPDLPAALAGTLRGYQREGVRWLYRRALNERAALLADDMGLGKTLQTLAFLKLWKTHQAHAQQLPALVVCPATLLTTWRDEAEKFIPDFNVLIMHGAKRKEYYEVMASADLIVTSYALLDKDVVHYESLPLAAMVLDEASAIRNPGTLAAKAARRVRQSAADAACVAITGTPVENSLGDLWSIFAFLMPGYLGGKEDFRKRYELPCAADMPDRAALQRLRWRTEPFMLRRVKTEVAQDLPPKIENIVWCELSPMQREHYEGILRHGQEKIDAVRDSSGTEAARMQMLTILLRLRQSCCDLRLVDDGIKSKGVEHVSAKLARLVELLGEARRGGHRVLVFSQFTSMLALIRSELDAEDVDYCYLDGSTRDRAAEVERFQSAQGPPVFLISLKAGGYGLTLTAADTVVLFDPWWNPAVEAQAVDRIHRIGQTKPATIYKFVARGTVEEKILKLQDRKRGMITAAMGETADEAQPMMKGLSEQEMLEMLA